MILPLPATLMGRLVALIALLAMLGIGWAYVKNLRADVRLAQSERDAAVRRAADFERAYGAIAAAAREQSGKLLDLAEAQEAARIEGEKKAAAARTEAAQHKARADELAKRQFTPGRDPVEEVSAWVDELLQAERK